jgi:hypothetical protein
MAENDNILGRKIFFLYPSAVVMNRITEELIQQEFEVYLIKDHQKVKKALHKYPDSIVFANINDGMNEKEWEAWIRTVQTAAPKVSVGIMSANEDEAIKTKYINQLKIKGGYTVVKSDLVTVLKQLFEILNALEAKGRRKYIRAITQNEPNNTVNLPHNGDFAKGAIHDISVVGFSCSFDNDPDLIKNSLIQDIQVKLQTNILKTEGIVFGSRMEGAKKIYVILFTQRNDPDTKARIRRYIQSNLQEKMDKEFK